jgi:hypothetical protein
MNLQTSMLIPISVSIGASIFGALVFSAIFRRLSPAIVGADYRTCAGDWHEAQLYGCASGLTAIPQQPVNTYTNLAYLAAGVFASLFFGTATSYVFGITMIYLCIGSTLYHALSTRWSGMLDVTGIYIVFLSIAVYALATLFALPRPLIPALMLVVSSGLAYILHKRFHKNMRLIIGILLGGIYVFSLMRLWLSGFWEPWPFILASFLIFLFAFFCWSLDKSRMFPLRAWGHGLWHILTALATLLLFMAIHMANS